jgi:hypothetical protein
MDPGFKQKYDYFHDIFLVEHTGMIPRLIWGQHIMNSVVLALYQVQEEL